MRERIRMAEVLFDVVEEILAGLDVKDVIRCKSVCKSWRSLISSPCFVKSHFNYVLFDVVEEILVRLDVKDLIRCKSVCKSWQSLISSPSFVKAHLNHAYTNDRNNPCFVHRRIGNAISCSEQWWLPLGRLYVVGSSNGLVCLSPTNVEFVVTNPCTRETKKLQPPPPSETTTNSLRSVVCWGFGYDSSTDDYKVIAGFKKASSTTFYVLPLKSNIWKLIGRVNYACPADRNVTGVLHGGALFWLMTGGDAKGCVIVSLDLSTHEFKEIAKPEDRPKCPYTLGVLEDCLCLYSISSNLRCKKLVMKDNGWERHSNGYAGKYDVSHRVFESGNTFYTPDDDLHVKINWAYIRASIFVKSLVSPHPYAKQGPESLQGVVKGNLAKKRKR